MSNEDEQDRHSSNLGQYRGFSTSISSLFHEPQDCCSLVYCGIFQWDFNYFLLKAEQPRSFGNILCLFLNIPVLLLFIMAACSIFIKEEGTKQATVSAVGFVLLIYCVILAVIETKKRIAFRRELADIVAKKQTEELREEVKYQSESDSFCAYYCCYPRDNLYIEDNSSLEHDFCTRIFQCFECLCCGCFFQCWLQCCGACAISQEGREIRMLVDKKKIHSDYITFEVCYFTVNSFTFHSTYITCIYLVFKYEKPYNDYFPRLTHLRETQNKNLF